VVGTFCGLGHYVVGTFLWLGRYHGWDSLWFGRFMAETVCGLDVLWLGHLVVGRFGVGRFVGYYRQILAVRGSDDFNGNGGILLLLPDFLNSYFVLLAWQ